VESVILPDGEKYKDMVGILCFELINLCVLRYDWGSIKSMCMLDLIGYSYESL
jgi:hypothetical protein